MTRFERIFSAHIPVVCDSDPLAIMGQTPPLSHTGSALDAHRILALAARFHSCFRPLSKALKWQVVIEKNVKIIVVDSVASLARHEFNGAALASRQAELTKEAQVVL